MSEDVPAEKIAALTVRRVALAEVKPHPKNPRKHPAEGARAWEILRASLAHDYFDPELDPKYCAVILERMSALGLPITRDGGSLA